MKYKIQNIGTQAIQVSSSTEFALCMVQPQAYQIVADTVKDELLAVYGTDVINVIGAVEDYAAPIYKQFTATGSWVLCDLGDYRTNFKFVNLHATNGAIISFSGYTAPATAPPTAHQITLYGYSTTSIGTYGGITINRPMNPERYFMLKAAAGGPVIEVLAV